MVDFGMYRMFVRDFSGVGWLVDPGMGKTFSYLMMLEELFGYKAIRRVLIIAPRRVCRMVWPREAQKWGFPFRINSLCGLSKDKIYHSLRTTTADIDLINPESVHKLIDIYGYWDAVGVDESTKFQNWSGVITKGVKKRRGGRMKSLRKCLDNGIRKRTIMTGTPAANSLQALFAQMYILDDGATLGPSIESFRRQFMYKDFSGYWKMRPEMVPYMQELIRPSVVRLDAASYLDMPQLNIVDRYCELPPNARPRYNELRRELYTSLQSGDILAVNSISARMKCRQFANGAVFDEHKEVHHAHDAKLDMLCDLVDELNGNRLMVGYVFSHDRDRIKTRFPNAPVLCSGVSDDDTERICDGWNRDEFPVFLVQCQAGSHGLNLQEGSCHHVALYGMSEDADVVDQLIRRVQRQGNTNPRVFIHRLLTADTIDDTIAGNVDGKFQTQEAFLNALRVHALG